MLIFSLLILAVSASPASPALQRAPLPPSPSADDVRTFAHAMAAGGDFVLPPGLSGEPPPPPAGSGANLLDVSQYGDLVILKDADGEWFSEATSHAVGGDVNWVMGSAAGAFYKSYEDEYDFLTVLMVHDLGMFFAFYQPLANDVKGIGYDSITAGEVFDQSDNELQGYIFMNYYGLWSENRAQGRYVFGQEFMHRWGSFVNIDALGPDGEPLDENALLGRDLAHWSYWFDTPNSPMEGNAWLDNTDGTFTVDLDATSNYCDLDMYLMGFIGPDDVGSQSLLIVDDAEQADVGRDAASAPEAFSDVYDGSGRATTVAATAVAITLDDVIAAEGARSPTSEESQKTFRMAFLVILLAADEPDAALLDEVDSVRLNFEADWEEDVHGLADLDTTLGEGTAPAWVDENAPVDTGDSGSAGDTETPTHSGHGCSALAPHSTGWGTVWAYAVAGVLLAGRRRRVESNG